MFVDELSVNNV